MSLPSLIFSITIGKSLYCVSCDWGTLMPFTYSIRLFIEIMCLKAEPSMEREVEYKVTIWTWQRVPLR